MLSNSNVFILLILVKHFTLFWTIVLTGAIAAHATSTIEIVDATTNTPIAATTAASNFPNSFDYYKNVVSSVAHAQKARNQQINTESRTSDDGAAETASSTTKVYRLNGTAASEDGRALLHNNGSHFNVNATKDHKPSTLLSTPSISTSIFQAAKTNAWSTMTPTSSAQIQTLSKLKLPDLSRKNKSSNDNNNNNNINSNDRVVRVSVGIDGNGNSNDSSQSHNHKHNVNNNNKNHNDDGAEADDDSGNNELPQGDSSTIDLLTSRLPEFPQRSDAVYFIVAVTGGAKIWSRTLARTLIEMGPPFDSPQGPPLRPLYIDLPANGRFSVKVLQSLCEQTENRPVAGLVVIGNGQAARAVSLAGTSMQLPVLWAKGGVANLHGTSGEVYSPLKTLLQPSANEILKAIRALFLQTHWHSFFVLSDIHATSVLAASKGNPLKEPPLVPTILPLPRTNDDVFKQLAQISRSTRGVVLMLCELPATRRIMSEAQRLNMVGGHFIWLWADTTSTTEFFDEQHRTEAASDNFGPTMHVNGTAPRPTKIQNRDVKSESIRATVVPLHSFSNGTTIANATKTTSIEANAGERDDLRRENTKAPAHRTDDHNENGKVEKEDLNFSEGFDPFRLKQRQYDKTRRQERFGHGNLMREKALPANGLILGLHGSAVEHQNLGGDSHTKKSRRNINGDDYDGDGDSSREHIFVSDQTNTHSVSSRNSSSVGIKRNFSEPDVSSPDDSIDNNNNNFNGNPFKLRKRTSAATNSSSSSNSSSPPSPSFVLYHHFKDFPIGLLALRPQRMNVDRHFIRATVRVFAATWARIDAESKQQKYQATVINAAAARIGATSRNAKNDRLQYERRMRRKRNIGTVNALLVAAVSANHQSITTQVNSSQQQLHLNENIEHNNNLIRINSSDLNANANIKHINDRNVNRNGNSSNQNSSGLTKQSLTKSNNDRNVHAMRAVNASHHTIVGKNASEAIRRNFMFDANTQRVNKRQNTWWSLEKETLEQFSSNAGHDAVGTCETPRYLGGCFGEPNKQDVINAEHFASALRNASILALSGQRIHGTVETALTATFELLNLVPADKLNPLKSAYNQEKYDRQRPKSGGGDATERGSNKRLAVTLTSADNSEVVSKWRRVGSVSGSTVRLDTIIWPGGDIVVSGLSARARSVFRVVTALSPPFVMESELDEDGLCLRGLPCHFLSPIGRHNLTLMFNAIETRDRLEEDAVEHGNDLPPEPEHLDEKIYHETKCCYGLSMDLLDNVATELGFEFHLYVVRDQLFGAQKPRTVHDHLANGKQSVNQQSSPPPTSSTARSKGTEPWPAAGHADTHNRQLVSVVYIDLHLRIVYQNEQTF